MTDLLVGNDWSVLVPGPDATWTPSRRVSVCIPCRNPSKNLERVLDALELQTYPRELIEVVIADDGSDQPVAVAPDRPFPVRVVRLERTLDFGAGRARNAAAAAATGDVFVFLDADIVPERQVVTAYVRWFEQRQDLLVMGLCRFADMDDLTDDAFRELVSEGGLATHFDGQEVDDQAWRENTFRRTDDLRREAVDAFRITIGATFAITADLWRAVGGFREVGVRGIEDTEFGYRVHADGAVLVVDRDAVHWHQGRRNLSAERRRQIRSDRRPYVERLLPVEGFRDGVPAPLHEPVATVPRAIVHVAPGPDADARRDTVAAAVPGDCVVVVGDVDPADVDRLPFVASFCHVWLPASAGIHERTIPALVDELSERNVGVVVVGATKGEQVLAMRTRARRRILREVGPSADFVDEITRRFGRWHLPAASADITWAGADEPGDGPSQRP